MSDRSGPDREEVGQLSPARPAVEIVRHIRCSYVPGYAPTPPPKPVCRRSARCDGCPYPSHGFLCWGTGEDCMRTRVEEINNRKKGI